MGWSAATDFETACRRAAGRRRYNATRRVNARLRQLEVLHLLRAYGMVHGVQARIARELGVSQATISRDMMAVIGLVLERRDHLRPY